MHKLHNFFAHFIIVQLQHFISNKSGIHFISFLTTYKRMFNEFEVLFGGFDILTLQALILVCAFDNSSSISSRITSLHNEREVFFSETC